MSTIPIVQGVAVGTESSKYSPSYQGGGGVSYSVPSSELRQNPIKQYQDVVWTFAFVAHLVAVLSLIFYNLSNRSAANNNQFSGSLNGSIFMVVLVTGISAVIMAACAVSSMMRHTETLVQTALIFSVLTSLMLAILGFMTGSLIMGILGLLCFAVGICYARIVWPRIPFAAQNLKTALSAVKQNMGLNVVAYTFTVLAFAWTILWSMGLGGALSDNQLVVVFLFFLSYYWVHQVLQNTIHVTTAGTVSTWWFVPDEASSFWSQGLTDSLFRATTYSFGSICFGSFLLAFVQALRALEYYSRDNEDFRFLSCLIQCILACIESIIDYLNKWAYVYVGMYGFSYLEAGRNVIQLFESKGWTVIISDDLVDNVLFMMSIAIAIASGLVGLIMGVSDPSMFEAMGYDHAGGPAFLLGFLTGLLFSAVIMSVIGSAVNTVIVCYAEDPAAFQRNHPQLSTDMRAAWVQAWPGVIE